MTNEIGHIQFMCGECGLIRKTWWYLMQHQGISKKCADANIVWVRVVAIESRALTEEDFMKP